MRHVSKLHIYAYTRQMIQNDSKSLNNYIEHQLSDVIEGVNFKFRINTK